MTNAPSGLPVVFRCEHAGTILNPYPNNYTASAMAQQACALVDCPSCQKDQQLVPPGETDLRPTKSVMLHNFDADLWRQARVEAIKRGIPVARLVERAISFYLESAP